MKRSILSVSVGRAALSRATAVLVTAVVTACDDPLVDPATVIGPRVVGARVQGADGASAEPVAGEAATIDWLVLSNEPGAFDASVAFCVAEPSSIGAPRCAAPPFAERRAEGTFAAPLNFDFELPGSLEDDGYQAVARLGLAF